MPSLWRRWFGRAGDATTAITAGRLRSGSAFSWRGWLPSAPFRRPRRDYVLYVPRNASRWRALPLIVLCHGCKQTPEEILAGTRIGELADRLPAYVLMPRQHRSANEWHCWNWFDTRTAAGNGEAAIVVAMMHKATRFRRIDRPRTIAAGMSAGAALAAILGIRYPDQVRGVFSHSGLASGAASSPFTAMTVMRRGPDTDIVAIAHEARAASGTDRPVALLAVVGCADELVAPRNSSALARQYLAFNGVAVPEGAQSSLPPAERDERDSTDYHHAMRIREWNRDGVPLVRLVEIDGLSHAWSGGDPAVPLHDGKTPDATVMLEEWLASRPR